MSTGECAVCLSATTTRCSGCKRVFFCTPQHQAILWPTHKHLCKIRDTETFYHPPLTEGEAEFARQHLRESQVEGNFCGIYPELAGKTVIELVDALGIYSGTFDDMIEGITAGSSDPIEEPYLSALAIVVRAHLLNPMRRLRGPQYHAQPFAYRCHSMFALLSLEFIASQTATEHRFEEPEHPRSTFRLLNEWFRTTLDFSTAFRWNGEKEEEFTNDMLLPMLERVGKVDRRGWDPRFQDLALDSISSTRMSLSMQGCDVGNAGLQ